MQRYILINLLCIFILSSPLLFAIEGRLMRYPDIYQDKIVFTYEDDLWLVSSHRGTAARIISHPGSEKYAKFSTDGKRIAFTASYDGNEDVYIISSKGGEPERLTYHRNCKFNNLIHMLNVDGLRECFERLKQGKTPGIDGVSVKDCEKARIQFRIFGIEA